MMLARNPNPQPLWDLRREFDRLFNNFGDDFGLTRPSPALNIWEDEKNVYAEAEVPGIKMDDLEVFVSGPDLTIKGHREFSEQEQGANFHRRERGYGEFSRTMTLPTEVESDKVEATLKDGVLTVTMPKAASAQPRKIAVRSN